jgi:nucleoside phosphorylase
MIYVVTALYQEAHGFIRELELKKNTAYAPFEVFDNESAGIRLVVTGVGEIAAAAATAAVCARDGADASDFLINIGCCAAANAGADSGCETVDSGMDSGSRAVNAAQIGDLYVCHKITEQATGKTFYPDILYRHPWKERELVTGMQPLQRAAAHGALYDMEAAAVYQAGIRFFSPDRMLFLKVVSDFGIAGQERMTAEALTGLLEQYVKEVAAFLTNLREAADEEETLRNDGILQEDEAVLERLFAALHCSQTMRASARQYITYAALTGYDWKAELEEWYARGLLPCKDRREGKVRLEELKQVLL